MLLPAIPSALDQIIHYFGDDKVAEVTGRSKRLIYKEGKMLVSKRNAKSNTVETNAFMDDKKQILIFSKSGGTGRSYHADLSRKNQRRRIHYLLEAGWKADDAIQGLGRSHRTNQASAPMFRPVATNVKGEKRFLATIAKRLDSMGAITKGERKSGSQGMFREEDNLDTEYARKALNTFFDEVFYGNKESVITLDELERKTGLRFTNKDGTKKDNLPPITQFLNRMLALEINVQNMLFARFDEIHQAIIRDAKASGVFEVGVEDFKAYNITLKETHHIYTHERTHTETTLKIFTTYHKIIIRNAQEMLEKLLDNEEVEFTRNKISQRVAIAYNGGQSIDMKTGRPYKQKHIVRPNNSSINIKPEEFYDKYEPLTDNQGIEMWNTEIKDLSTVQEKQVNLITGALLPIWSNLPTGNNKVYRLTDDDGNSHLGVVVGNEHIENFINRLQNRDNTDLSSEELANKIINNNVVEFMNNWQVKQSLVMSMARIEVVIPANKMIEEFELDKLKSEFLAFTEIINYQLRIFIPTTYLIDILEYLTKAYHIKA